MKRRIWKCVDVPWNKNHVIIQITVCITCTHLPTNLGTDETRIIVWTARRNFLLFFVASQVHISFYICSSYTTLATFPASDAIVPLLSAAVLPPGGQHSHPRHRHQDLPWGTERRRNVEKTSEKTDFYILHFKAGSDHMIREYTEREDKMTDVTVPPAVWKDQNEIVNHLTLRKEVLEKLQFGS